MAREYSLMQRLDHTEQESARVTETDQEKLLKSVLQHLQDMFNTRQGNFTTLQDYGTPDFNEMVARFPDAITEIRKAIQVSLTQYEPRLENVRVKHSAANPDNPLDLSFVIEAQLTSRNSRSRVSFTTIMGDSGRIKVRG